MVPTDGELDSLSHDDLVQEVVRLRSGIRRHQEYGRLVKTLFILRYLQRPELRKRVGRQLNKGESLHALREKVHFAHHGNVRHRQLADQAAPGTRCGL